MVRYPGTPFPISEFRLQSLNTSSEKMVASTITKFSGHKASEINCYKIKRICENIFRKYNFQKLHLKPKIAGRRFGCSLVHN